MYTLCWDSPNRSASPIIRTLIIFSEIAMNRDGCLFLSETMTERKTDSFDGLHDPGSDVLCLEIVLLSGERRKQKN